MKASAEGALREDLVVRYRDAAARGLNELASGNLSCRLGDDAMLISPSGATADTITRDNVVRMTFDGVSGGADRPSSEWRMHAAIYARHPAAGAVVHTHSDHCVALASHGIALPGFHYLVGVFGSTDVPCIPYSTFGSQALADGAAQALAECSASLLANHGMICRGADLTEAVALAHQLEILCRQYLLARALGEPHRLSKAQWAAFFERFAALDYGP